MSTHEKYPLAKSADSETYAVDYDVFKDVHGRFNLALGTDQTADVIQTDNDQEQHRYLVTPADPKTRAIQSKLENAGIAHLDMYVEENDFFVFQVDLHAKPLIHERLFPDRPSTDTYISDEELFTKLGQLWRSVFDVTGHMPTEGVVAKTGMTEFGATGNRLFPIPSYASWEEIDQEEALQVFESQIGKELVETYPMMSVQNLVEAATNGFKG